jgi:hypothetical protein
MDLLYKLLYNIYKIWTVQIDSNLDIIVIDEKFLVFKEIN